MPIETLGPGAFETIKPPIRNALPPPQSRIQQPAAQQQQQVPARAAQELQSPKDFRSWLFSDSGLYGGDPDQRFDMKQAQSLYQGYVSEFSRSQQASATADYRNQVLGLRNQELQRGLGNDAYSRGQDTYNRQRDSYGDYRSEFESDRRFDQTRANSLNTANLGRDRLKFDQQKVATGNERYASEAPDRAARSQALVDNAKAARSNSKLSEIRLLMEKKGGSGIKITGSAIASIHSNLLEAKVMAGERGLSPEDEKLLKLSGSITLRELGRIDAALSSATNTPQVQPSSQAAVNPGEFRTIASDGGIWIGTKEELDQKFPEGWEPDGA